MLSRVLDASFNQRLFERLAKWARQASALWVLALWAIGEATFWFILPDFLLLPLAILAPRRSPAFGLVALASSLLGTILFSWFCLVTGPGLMDWLLRIPFTYAAMLTKLQGWLQEYGTTAFLWQSVSGVPVKLWAFEAVQNQGWQVWSFLPYLAISRGLRMAGVLVVGVLLNQFCRAFIRRWTLPLLMGFCLAFLAGLVRVSQ